MGRELHLYFYDNGEESEMPSYGKFYQEVLQYQTKYSTLETYPDEFQLLYKPKIKFSDLSAEDKILSFRSLTLYANGDVKGN